MNYKENYEKSIERAKEALNSGSYDRETIEYIFPEFKESEDEKIRKAIIELIKMVNKNPIQQLFGYENITYSDMLAWLERQDKPKFKVGDWICNGIDVNQIVNINTNENEYMFDNGTSSDIELVDNISHLWTINDAKEGDILVSLNPFIFKGFNDKMNPNNPTAYCGIDLTNNLIISKGKHHWTAHEVHPATKKEADLLLQRIEEEGYEWDATKKELRPIIY